MPLLEPDLARRGALLAMAAAAASAGTACSRAVNAPFFGYTLLIDRRGRTVWRHVGEPDFTALQAQLERRQAAPA